MSEIIENGAVTAAEEQAADAGGQQEMMDGSAVTLSEILSDAQDKNAERPEAGAAPQESETVETGDDGPADPNEADATTEATPDVYRTQAEFDAAFSKRMANERARNRPFVEMGREVMTVAGDELSAQEIRAAIAHALAEKRSKANSTDYDTEMNNIRVEQRIAQRYGEKPEQEGAAQTADDPAARAREMIEAMEAIGDEKFNVGALQGNQAAMVAWAGGATPAQVYRQFFLSTPEQPTKPVQRSKRPAPERASNSGAMGVPVPARAFSADEIRKIDEFLAKTNGTIRLS